MMPHLARASSVVAAAAAAAAKYPHLRQAAVFRMQLPATPLIGESLTIMMSASPIL